MKSDEKFPLGDVEVAELTFGHSDDRRTIWDAKGKSFSANQFFINGEARLGDHTHVLRDELFWIMKGTGILYLQRVEDGLPIGEIKTVDLYPGMVISIPHGIAHTFVFDYASGPDGQEILNEMLQVSNMPFSDEDTVKTPLDVQI